MSREPYKRADYAPDQTREGVWLVRENVEAVRQFAFVEGRCAAYPPDVVLPDERERRIRDMCQAYIAEIHYERDFAEIEAERFSMPSPKNYREQILNQLIAYEVINDGRNGGFNDRKFRIDAFRIKCDTFEMAVGLSHYKEFRADVDRRPNYNKTLRELGRQFHQNEWAFHSRCPGVAALVITADGSAVVYERMKGEDRSGELNTVAGHWNFREERRKINVYADVFRELREELGISRKRVKDLRFVGAYLDPSREASTDLTFIASTDVPDKELEEGGWRRRVEKREQAKEPVLLRSHVEVEELLESRVVPGSDRKCLIMCSTEGALRSLHPPELKR